MNPSNKRKIFNDPIYGFISIPNDLVYDLIEHRYFQRLRRISQMGLSSLVYPGAHHTRFHHALGAMHLMDRSIEVLRSKGVEISEAEAEALLVAILLHDIGHGPFSHAMEHSIVEEVSHEELTLKFMFALNEEFNGRLDLAIQMFQGKYKRLFMLQLISSQLDMDRLDYLKRDSFYSGVHEGNVNSERLIQMLYVVNDTLVVEEKGVYSVEKFLMARRLMYWQAYLHKTSVVAELTLTKSLQRAKELAHKGENLWATPAFEHFLKNKITLEAFSKTDLEQFALLDDSDIISSLKQWQFHPDFVLQQLSKMIINRDLMRASFYEEKITSERLHQLRSAFAETNKISLHEASYFISKGKIKNQAYNKEAQPIGILKKNGTVEDIIEVSDQFNARAISRPVVKYYLCAPKQVRIS